MKIVNWQCHFTADQLYTWAALQNLIDSKIFHVVAKTTSEIRVKQGWPKIDMAEMDSVILNKKGWWRQSKNILKKHADHIQVFGGFWADRRFLPLIIYALLRGHRVVVINEAYSTKAVGYMSDSFWLINKVKVILRPLLYRLLAFVIKILTKPNQFCILAVSARAAMQFQLAGFEHKQVFPFGYFVPKLECSKKNQLQDASTIRFIFVAALLKRKGLDLLVAAVEALHLEGFPVCLDVFGPGEPGDYISSASLCVKYKGVIPYGQAQCEICNYDALVLPSRHDGWGVVVNEGLVQGVPVIVSSDVGAKCIIENNNAGMVFDSGDIGSLKKVLKEFISNRELRIIQKKNAEIVGDRILPANAAIFMRDVFKFHYAGQGERPKEIWCVQSSIK